MSRCTVVFAIVLTCLLPPPAAAQREGRQTTYALIRCESPGGRESFCAADTRRGVRLANTLAGRCQLGRSWGYEADGIWVRGCSAEFEIGDRGSDGGWGWGHNDGRTIVCTSESYRYSVCAIDTRGGVRLRNTISRAECVEDRTWGYDRRGIWVDQGCAAEFEVGAGGRPPGPGPGPGPGQGSGWNGGNQTGSTFLCESRDGRRQYCDVELRGRSATVLRNLSRVPCAEGETWGIDRRGMWVDGGCRDEFRIIETAAGSRPPIDRPQPGDAAMVGTVRCESRDFRRSECPLPAGVRSAGLLRQTSRAACTEGDTWGWDRGRLWVDRGCAGEFAGYR